MAGFDLNLFNSLVGGGGGLGAAGAAFGVPSCLLAFGAQLLSLLPAPILAAIVAAIEAGMKIADAVIKAIFNKIKDLFGIIDISLDGAFTFISDFLGYGPGAVLGLLGAFLGAATAVGNLYANYLLIADQIEQIKRCLENWRNYQKLQQSVDDAGMTPEQFDTFVDNSLAVEKSQLDAALAFIEAGANQLDTIGAILNERRLDPSKEPLLTQEACIYFSGTVLAGKCAPAEDDDPDKLAKPIFRLVFGPPKTSAGQFILSQDGLYFDSQTSGIRPAITYLAKKKSKLSRADLWKFSHDPNLGGRGKTFSTNDLKAYVNTILDPESINESPPIQNYYNMDGFLQELIGNKNKRIYDLSAQITELQDGSAPQSVIINYKQSLISENINFTKKINKRKKQIELAVVLPQIYGSETHYLPGEVPVNDFSYLSDINLAVDIQKQKSLLFSQVDVSSIVSPIDVNTNFVIPKIVNSKNSSLEHLVITETGDGAIIFDGSSVSAVDGVILQAENRLTTDKLIAMYNFLETDVELPSSLSFNLRNSASESDELYAQLVADSPEQIYSRGLGIPYLQGITRNSNSSPTNISALGSYMKLPATKEFNDLLYTAGGASIDFWTYVPSIFTSEGEGSVSSLYRLVLASENVGAVGTVNSTDTEYISNNRSSDVVRGFLMGFSRDRRLTQDSPASNNSADNPASQTVFFIAPTQSVTTSSAGLINRSVYDNAGCNADTRYHSMTNPLSNRMQDCSGEFCHFAVTFNPRDDEISFYFDGEKISTSSMSYVFGIEPYTMPNLPTFKLSNSFEYSLLSVGPTAPQSLRDGPKLDSYFTPWIVGGGYTDGMYSKGNFMGGTYGGIISGLRGYLGSIKFYSKPMIENEVLNNYNTHKDFFKNIDISKL